jgi:hypothetical protein
MARFNRSVLLTHSGNLSAEDARLEHVRRADRQSRLQCAEDIELSDAELQRVAAAGGGVRVGSDGANN